MSIFSQDSITIAVPPWAAAAPLLVGLERRGDVMVKRLPLESIAHELQRGGTTCALIPPALILRLPDLAILPGAGITARPGAATERILMEAPLADLRSLVVHPDLESLALYVELSFAQRGWSPPARIAPGDRPDAPTLCSALEGNPAAGPGHDIAALWEDCTALPLVLAAWVCTGPAHTRKLRQLLAESAREGSESMDSRGTAYRYELLSGESESLRMFHHLCRTHAIGGATAESMVFC